MSSGPAANDVMVVYGATMAGVSVHFHDRSQNLADRLASSLAEGGHQVRQQRWEPGRSPQLRRVGGEIHVVLLSQALLGTRGVDDELASARDTQRVLPVMIEQVDLGARHRLDTMNCLRLFEFDGPEGESALRRAIERADQGDMNPSSSADVFISYCFDDVAHADRIERCLGEAGYGTVRATDFMIGGDWVDAIDQAVRGSRIFVALLSPRYLASFWCYDEFYESASSQRLLVLIDECQLDEYWTDLIDVDLVGAPSRDICRQIRSGVRWRLVQPRPRESHRSTTDLDEFIHRGPWDVGLMERLYHPQLRARLGDGGPLSARKWAARRFERGDY